MDAAMWVASGGAPGPKCTLWQSWAGVEPRAVHGEFEPSPSMLCCHTGRGGLQLCARRARPAADAARQKSWGHAVEFRQTHANPSALGFTHVCHESGGLLSCKLAI